jgi:hypothetical protein
MYFGQSGTPYTWTVNGDVNGDGINGNDLAFIPADPTQISLSGSAAQQAAQYDALSTFIQSQDCLREAKGSFVKRGACRNPWESYVNMRVTWASPPIAGQRIELQFDIFNFLNLLSDRWGLYQEAAQFENHGSAFLRAVGYDRAASRPIYTFTEPQRVKNIVYSPTRSRWRMQLGARYMF